MDETYVAEDIKKRENLIKNSLINLLQDLDAGKCEKATLKVTDETYINFDKRHSCSFESKGAKRVTFTALIR